MTDPFLLDDEPHALVVPSAAIIPINDIPAPEWISLNQRMAAVEAGQDLGDLNNVETEGVLDGQTVVYDEETGLFVPGSSGGTVGEVTSQSGTSEVDAHRIYFRSGLRTLNSGSPGAVTVEPIFGTNAGTIAAGNHLHALPQTVIEPIPPQDYMSSGSRTLATAAVMLPESKECFVSAELDVQIRGGDPGPCYYRLQLEISGNTRTSPDGQQGYWAVQGVPKPGLWRYVQKLVGAGSDITVRARVLWGASGGGFYTDYGNLVVTVTPDR